jgi:hypothetical protein
MSRITEILSGRFPESYAHHLGELLSAFNDSGLASPHLVEEVSSGEDGKLWARVWEAMLYHHRRSIGIKFHVKAYPSASGSSISGGPRGESMSEQI